MQFDPSKPVEPNDRCAMFRIDEPMLERCLTPGEMHVIRGLLWELATAVKWISEDDVRRLYGWGREAQLSGPTLVLHWDNGCVGWVPQRDLIYLGPPDEELERGVRVRRRRKRAIPTGEIVTPVKS